LLGGILGIAGLWAGIVPGFQLLAAVATTAGCLIIPLSVYESRHDLRVQDLLDRSHSLRRRFALTVRWRSIIAPALAISLVLFLAFLLVTDDLVWSIVSMFALQSRPTQTGEGQATDAEGGEWQIRIQQAMPLIAMGLYVALMLSLSYSSALLLALRYAREMNRNLPLPIFMRDALLAQIVQQQAERALARPGGFRRRIAQGRVREVGQILKHPEGPPSEPRIIGASVSVFSGNPLAQVNRSDIAGLERWAERNEHSGGWNWEEMKRLPGGGILMRARSEECVGPYRGDFALLEQPAAVVVYEVTADRWANILEIRRTVGHL